MSEFFNRVRGMMGTSEAATEVSPGRSQQERAADGDRETLNSGVWSSKTGIPPEAFPKELVLTRSDRKLASGNSSEVILASTRVGRHTVELLLNGTKDTVDLSMRIPTAANQFKEPYIIMEAEAGNTGEVAVREIHFHLLGRASEEEIARADWMAFFASALTKLKDLRGRRR